MHHEARWIGSHLDLLLSLGGRAAGADRAYVLTFGSPRIEQIWCEADVSPPENWPISYVNRLSSYLEVRDCVFRKYFDDLSLPSALSDQLRKESMLALSCVKLKQNEEVIGVLCFERSKPFPTWLEEDEVILRVLGEVVSGAVQRGDAERRRSEIEAKLRRAERLRSIGMFTAGIAHNFNNVLSVIAGQAEMASELVEAASPVTQHVDRISEAAQRGRDLVEEILHYGRSAYSMSHPINLPKLIEESIQDFKMSIDGKSLRVRYHTDVTSACVLANKGQLHQVFLNIMQNAVHASRHDDEISVSMGVMEVDARRLSHGSVRAGTFARVSISDPGHGMEPAQQLRMFEPFYTTREGGTGLGLATAFQTIADIGGAFDVASELSVGTTVEIWLPISALKTEEAARGRTVLILGRDTKSMMSNEDLLAALGFEPVGFVDSEAALAALVADKERFDLIIADRSVFHDLQGRNLNRLAAAGKPIVLSVSENDEENLPQALKDTSVAVLFHPWHSNAVLAVLGRLLGT